MNKDKKGNIKEIIPIREGMTIHFRDISCLKDAVEKLEKFGYGLITNETDNSIYISYDPTLIEDANVIVVR